VIYLKPSSFEVVGAPGGGASVGPNARLGITVSKKIGIAVTRNRVKRRVRECFRLRLRREVPAFGDLVVIARAGAAKLDYAALCHELAIAIAHLSRRIVA
jgi:ribonuclease P protein component